ncbi:MAG TPA: hypothetical protein VK590_07010 [Saprospiraceae bacterium]|nr:hypothetical protein [Saprospiraceae bacterium]
MITPTNEKKQIYMQVNLFLDNQLEDSERSDFLTHLENNIHYSQMLHQEKHFRSLFKEKLTRTSVHPNLIEHIKKRVQD